MTKIKANKLKYKANMDKKVYVVVENWDIVGWDTDNDVVDVFQDAAQAGECFEKTIARVKNEYQNNTEDESNNFLADDNTYWSCTADGFFYSVKIVEKSLK